MSDSLPLPYMTPAHSPVVDGQYSPLEDYGIVGDLRTAALVNSNGSVDWCCLPFFNSPSVFGALLDSQNGGFFKISVANSERQKQFYLADSNVLATRFLSREGVGEITTFMPIHPPPARESQGSRLIRIVRSVRGNVPFRLRCAPAFGYGETSHRIVRRGKGITFHSQNLSLELSGSVPLKSAGESATADFTLAEGTSAVFVLGVPDGAASVLALSQLPAAEAALEDTLRYWRQWAGRMAYQGRWRERVTRSALTLKLLTFEPSGAIVAAPTTSLPELIGGARNWDYRSTWIRDASFTLYALLRLGYSGEAEAFMGWLQSRLAELGRDGSLQTVYGLEGQHRLPERIIRRWQGYRGSAPVRVGNAAARQYQLDIYGELMDSVYLYNKYGSPISADLWENLRKLLGYVCRHWRDKDQGIWEMRGGSFHFVYSKVMCWVALDRGLRLAAKRSLPADQSLWLRQRDAIYEEVMAKGWDGEHQSFVQHYGTTATDASLLIMPLVKFISPTDPRMLSTLKRIKKTLVVDNLVHRYEIGRGLGDGLTGREGTFSMCTFWFVEALARAGAVDEARDIFEKMLGYASPLGLYSEEIGPGGELLGNFPQAFTHLGMISAAYNLDKALTMRGRR